MHWIGDIDHEQVHREAHKRLLEIVAEIGGPPAAGRPVEDDAGSIVAWGERVQDTSEPTTSISALVGSARKAASSSRLSFKWESGLSATYLRQPASSEIRKETFIYCALAPWPAVR